MKVINKIEEPKFQEIRLKCIEAGQVFVFEGIKYAALAWTSAYLKKALHDDELIVISEKSAYRSFNWKYADTIVLLHPAKAYVVMEEE